MTTPATPSALIARVVADHEADLVALRRDLHAHPELSWAEHRTTGLETSGWRIQRLSPAGLVADLGTGERTVGLRADLDALPVQEVSEDPWRSTLPGVAHACGHDVHTSALVGAAHALARVHAGSSGAGCGCSSSPPRRSCPAGPCT